LKDNGSTTGRTGIQVIARAAAILRALRENTSGMSLAQIAERVDLPRSTVQRIVFALEAERLVIGSRGRGNIRLGPEIVALSEATRYSVVELCRAVLNDLSETVNETVDLSVLRGNNMIFLDQVPGRHRLRTVSAIGEVFPLTTTANGRAVLAMLPREKARELTEREWETREPGETWSLFSKRLDACAESGLAYDEDNHMPGVSAIGIAFTDHSDELHAISVPIPTSRFPEKQELVEAHLKAALERIEEIFSKPDA